VGTGAIEQQLEDVHDIRDGLGRHADFLKIVGRRREIAAWVHRSNGFVSGAALPATLRQENYRARR